MNLMDMGRRVKRRREELGMVQDDLAAKLHKTRGYVSRLENGKAGESVSDLIEVAKALGMKLSEMLGETDDEAAAEIRRRLPDGSELIVGFERIARALPNQPENEQTFIRTQIQTLADRFGQESEPPDRT